MANADADNSLIDMTRLLFQIRRLANEPA